jgi:hypothetical protein
MQSLVKHDSGVIAGEGSSRSIGPVHPRSKANDQPARIGVPESRNRSRMVARVASTRLLAELREPGTAATRRIEKNGGHPRPSYEGRGLYPSRVNRRRTALLRSIPSWPSRTTVRRSRSG